MIDVKDLSIICLSVKVPTISPAQDFVLAPVGVQMKDVEDRIFSNVVKITYGFELNCRL